MMKMKLRMMLFAAAIALVCSSTYAQFDVSFGADLNSRYIWRGLDLGGASPSIQPACELGWTNKGGNHRLALGAWSAYTFSGTANEEVDIYLGYTFKEMISLTVADYFFPGLNTGARANYFEYGPDSTGHVFEGTLSFNGTENIPFSLLFAMNFYGNDARKMIDDSTSGDIMMSKYAELAYNKSFKSFDFSAFVGVALDKADKISGASYYLNKDVNLINVGVKFSKEVKITDHYSLPLQCSLITNPEAKKIYTVFGISL